MTPAERPILFNAPMVRAILEGRKIMTRRVVKPQPADLPKLATHLARRGLPIWYCDGWSGACPYGRPGDRLWVRETWALIDKDDKPANLAQATALVYRADGLKVPNQRNPEIRAIFADRCRISLDAITWRPSIHMPRWASRTRLEIVAVRVERLNDISDAGPQNNCTDEGVYHCGMECPTYEQWRGAGFRSAEKFMYRQLWESINGPGSWQKNPWVWVVEFRRIFGRYE